MTTRSSSNDLDGSGRYQVFAELACGGMAMVYLGQLEGEHGFKRSIAVKRMHAQYARDPEFRGMFLDEARLVAKIRHPNVVPTLDIVSSVDALLLVMEYVDGESVAQIMGASGVGRVPLRVAAAIAQDALCGLHAAHELADADGNALGVIHRDVSPANILVGTDGLSRILDFGVAKAAGRSAPTRDGSIKGKVPYMPPEQLWGSELDRTVDVYAMSVVLWEMLTGRRLFRGDNDVDTMKRVVEEEVVPPSTFAPNVAALDDIVMRGLSRDPSKRFPTAIEMAKAIDKALTPASRLEIGEWVGTVASASLARRGELLRAMQRGDRAPVPQQVAALVTALMSMPVTAAGVSMTGQRALPRSSPLRRGLGIAAASVAMIAAIALTLAVRPMAERARAAHAAAAVTGAASEASAGLVVRDPAPAAVPAPVPATAPTPATDTKPTAAAAGSTPVTPSTAAPAGKRSWLAKPPAGRPAPHAAVAAVPAGAARATAAGEPPAGAVPAPVPGAALGSRY